MTTILPDESMIATINVNWTTTTTTAATVEFLTLTQTIVRHVFSVKGYAHQQDWEDYVNLTAIRNRCFFTPMVAASVEPGESDDSDEPHNSIECTVHEAANCLERFLHDENVHYFYIYIVFALLLITMAAVFNAIAITAVARCRSKYPRHHVFISLSFSDLLLTMTLLLKRCGDQEELLDEFTRYFLSNNVAVLFQIGYIMSAIGLLCLSLDNVLAIVAPYFYESLSRPLSTRILICCLWVVAITFATVIRLFNLQLSLVVQMAVCVAMLVLLVGILSSYIFACAQSHIHRRRLAVMTDDRRVVDLRNQLRGFLTTGLLVFWCLLCWSPLVVYLLTDVDTLSSAHRFFTRYLVVAMLVLHLNSVVDPIIYCLRLRDIRKSLFQLLGIHKRNFRNQSVMNSRYSASQYSAGGGSGSAINGSGSRKSAPSFMHSDSYRRSLCVEMSNGSNSNVNGTNQQNDPLIPTRLPTIESSDNELDKDDLEGNHNGATALLSNGQLPQKNRQIRAYSAIAIPVTGFGGTGNGIGNGASCIRPEIRSLNGIASLAAKQRKTFRDTGVRSLNDDSVTPTTVSSVETEHSSVQLNSTAPAICNGSSSSNTTLNSNGFIASKAGDGITAASSMDVVSEEQEVEILKSSKSESFHNNNLAA